MNSASGPLKVLLAGDLVPGEGHIDVVNPASGERAAVAPMGSVAQLDSAVAAARAALGGWTDDADRRSAILDRLSGIITERRDELARMLSLETGLPFKCAQDEILMAAGFLTYRSGSRLPLETLYDDARQRVEVIRRPVGVVGAIVPWNAPMMIACEKIGTAFAAGNTVVVKPSPLAPLTLLLLGQLVRDAVPRGVLSILPGDDALGKALVAHSDTRMISFTGSVRGGREIMAAAAVRLKRLSLELGGNDAAIVLPDVGVQKIASRLYLGAFYRSGQVCAAIKRLYVHRSAFDDLVAALRQRAEQAILGGPFEEGVTMGPLSNRPQFNRVRSLVGASVAAGGIIVTGGEPLKRSGFFYPPTLVIGVDEANPLVREEQFGPALPIIPYTDVDDAIDAANAGDFGLGGSVWTDDLVRGAALARRLECGTAWVNRHGIVVPDTPFGGMKQSGVGRANGQAGLESYAELQTVSVALPRT
jgi:acyl-CoA reductase-like NAD-dependent aldehyde dehydrogenase